MMDIMMANKKIKNFIFLALLFFCFVGQGATQTNDTILNEAARKVVESYCHLEFKYNQSSRNDLIITTPSYDKNYYQENGNFDDTPYPGSLDYESNKIFLVKSYKILNVRLKKNQGIATVSYDVLAKRDNWPDKKAIYYDYDGLHEYRNPNYIEKINLTYDGKYWLILNPPVSKISIDEVTGIYKKDFQSTINAYKNTNDLKGLQLELSDPKGIINSKKKIVDLLESLGGNSSKATNLFVKKPQSFQGKKSEDYIQYRADEFLRVEFLGDDFEVRQSDISYSQIVANKIMSLYHIPPAMIIWKINPLTVISGYKILNVDYNRDKNKAVTGAVITVQYDVLGFSQGDGSGGVLTRTLVLANEKNEIVKLKIKQVKIDMFDSWRIIDPPPPHISKDALIAYYENDIKSFGDNYLARTDVTDQQKQEYQKELDTLEFLKKL
jgi:hypothetical protein